MDMSKESLPPPAPSSSKASETALLVLGNYSAEWVVQGAQGGLCWTQMTHALSNEVYKCENRATGEKVLVRVFISDRTAINTDVLMRVATTLGPKILATCDEGAVEEWIQGRCMTHAEIISPAFMPKLASALRTLHQDAKVCHNDLHQLNVLIDDEDNVWLIDYEYTCENTSDDDWALDIANHILEWQYDYGGGCVGGHTSSDDPDGWASPVPGMREKLPSLAKTFCDLYFACDTPIASLELIQSQFPRIHNRWLEWARYHLDKTGDAVYSTYIAGREHMLTHPIALV